MLTDGDGIPISIQVEGANRHDVKLAEPTLENVIIQRPKPTTNKKQNLCVDQGYQGDDVKELAEELKYTLHLRSRKDEVKKSAKKKARRWVVERTISWLNRFRRLLIRWEKKAENYLAMLHLAYGIITWRACLCG